MLITQNTIQNLQISLRTIHGFQVLIDDLKQVILVVPCTKMISYRKSTSLPGCDTPHQLIVI